MRADARAIIETSHGIHARDASRRRSAIGASGDRASVDRAISDLAMVDPCGIAQSKMDRQSPVRPIAD
jgi:hypothetical protein